MDVNWAIPAGEQADVLLPERAKTARPRSRGEIFPIPVPIPIPIPERGSCTRRGPCPQNIPENSAASYSLNI